MFGSHVAMDRPGVFDDDAYLSETTVFESETGEELTETGQDQTMVRDLITWTVTIENLLDA